VHGPGGANPLAKAQGVRDMNLNANQAREELDRAMIILPRYEAPELARFSPV
jgi:hypothetical protein